MKRTMYQAARHTPKKFVVSSILAGGAKKKGHRRHFEPPQIVQTVQKEPLVQEYSVLAGVAQRERRHSCFALDALVVVKMDVTVNHLIGFREGRRFVAVDTLRFEDGEEIFRHSVVIRVPTS